MSDQSVSVFDGLTQEITLAQVRDSLAGVLETADASPPLTCIAAGGVDLAANTATDVVDANPGRVYVTVQHIGTSGHVFITCNQDSANGIGERLDPGQQWNAFTTDPVSAFATASGRVATTEWAAQ